MVRPINLKFSEQTAATTLTSAAFVQVVDGTAPALANYRAPVGDLVPEVDVRRYGTTGTADDTATLVAALAAAPAGGVVVVPKGVTLTIEGVSVSGREVRGPGVLKYKANASSPMLTLTGAGSCLRGVVLDGNRANQGTDQNSVLISAADGWRVVGCTFHSFRARVVVSGVADSPNGLVEGCLFYDIGATGVGCDTVCLRSPRCTVSNSWFRDIDDGHGVRVGLFGGDATGTAVTGSVINGCHFYNTNHNGVTLELYAQDTIINSCHFELLDQAIKADSDPSVHGISITDCYMRDIALATALNLTCPEVTFSNNRCYDMAGGPIFAGIATCNGNYFNNVGTAAANATITTSGGLGKLTCHGNQVIDAPYRAIVADGPAEIVGNYIENCGDTAIRFAGSDNTVQGNTIAGAVNGIVPTSTATNSVVSGNTLSSIGTTTIAVTNNTAAFDTLIIRDNAGAGALVVAKTIATGAIVAPLSQMGIALINEGGAATDDLDIITPATGIQPGWVIVIRPNSSSQDPTIRDVATPAPGGNIHLVGAVNFAMLTSAYRMALMWSGTFWQELWRSTT
jgi:hypothetical protein